jgi:tRNA pseudouridine32 synthase/23S rRNA pseudouridine746 synthase
MKIHFQNEAFVILDKDSGVLSVPSRFPDRDERLVAGLELEKLLSKQVFPVHRLDCEVSGILLFA